MTARPTGKLALTIPLLFLAALLVLYVTLRSGAWSLPGHLAPGTAPAVAPAVTTTIDQPANSAAGVNPASSAGGGSATGAGRPSGTVPSGGPEDAGPDATQQGSVGSQVCAPKICRP